MKTLHLIYRSLRTKALFAFVLFAFSASVAYAQPAGSSDLKYYGSETFLLEGSAIPVNEKESMFDRLPSSSKGKVRQPVWDLSKNSAGMSLRFITNSSTIAVKWDLLNDTRMNHMAETGIKGVDLYCLVDGKWRYINTGRPSSKSNTSVLVSGLPAGEREFRLYLPLYDGVTDVRIGVTNASNIRKANPETTLPVIFYGTSITQGGCASRPGMAYTSIISRKMNAECINLGFSGNGRMEQPVAEVIAAKPASFIVIDCLPNMLPPEIASNVGPLVNTIRNKQPLTPIVFVENIDYAKTPFEQELRETLLKKNQTLRSKFDSLKAAGVKNLYYISSKNATGSDAEGSVDGVHLTDLGFQRLADHLLAAFRKNKLRLKPAGS